MPRSCCQKDLLQGLWTGVLHTDRNEEVLPVLSLWQSGLSKGIKVAAKVCEKRSHLPDLRQYIHTEAVGCQVLL